MGELLNRYRTIREEVGPESLIRGLLEAAPTHSVPVADKIYDTLLSEHVQLSLPDFAKGLIIGMDVCTDLEGPETIITYILSFLRYCKVKNITIDLQLGDWE